MASAHPAALSRPCRRREIVGKRLLDTTSLSGREWVVVLARSLIAPAVVATDKLIQLSRQRKVRTAQGAELTPTGSLVE
jgi:hypothetical protein